MNCYSSNIQAFVLSERFNRAYLICENYWYNGLAKDASLSPHSQDSFTLVDYDTVYRGTVKVDFTDHPEDMYEGAFSILQNILGSDTPIAILIMRAIKNKEYAIFTVDMKGILDPDENDIDLEQFSQEEIDDKYGKYVVEINPELAVKE